MQSFSRRSRKQRRPSARTPLGIERLEERWDPATILALTGANALLSFDTTTPATVTTTTISGLNGGESVLGVDFNPTNGTLYGITSANNLVTINTSTGAASVVAQLTPDASDASNPFTALAGTSFGVDFNPTNGLLRVVSDADQSLRINVTNGKVTTDAALTYGTAVDPAITAVAYTNNFTGTASTSLYGLDAGTNSLTTINFMTGQLTTVGVGIGGGFDITSETGFDISTTGGQSNLAYATVSGGGQTRLATIDLNTGLASAVGVLGTGALDIRGLAIVPAGTLNFSLSSVTVNENVGTATVIVTRTGGSLGAITVDYAATAGTATAGADFNVTSGTLNFSTGQTSATFNVSILDDQLAEGIESINIALTNPTSGVSFGVDGTATIVIRDNEAPRTVMYAVTSAKVLIEFDSSNLELIRRTTPIQGLTAGEVVAGLDIRPADNKIYAVVRNETTARLVVINPRTGFALQVGSTFNLTGTSFGVDFNPTADRLRVVSDAEVNLSINPDTGAVTTQTNITPAGNFVAAAYTNSFNGAGTTQLYTIDSATDSLYLQNPPAAGTVTLVGSLGIDITDATSFEIVPFNNQAFAILKSASAASSSLYSINLTTGAATEIGDLGVTGDIAGMASISYNDQYYSANERFVNQLYIDLLGRAAEPGGLAYWVAFLNGGASRDAVANGIVNATEARQTAITDLYQQILGRNASSAELNYYSGLINNGTTYQQVRAGLAGSAEFYSNSGGTNSSFVSALYLNVLGRAATPSESNAALQSLTNGVAREQIASDLIYTTDGLNASAIDLYRLYLGRTPTQQEITNVSNALNSGVRLEQIIVNLSSSLEYYNRTQVA